MSRARDLGSSINSSVAGKNYIINGNFDFWQRGTSFTYAGSGAAVYTADRFTFTQAPTAANYVITQSTDVPNGNSVYSYKCTAAAAHSSTVEYAMRHWIEGSNAAMLIGKSVTLSFWYKSNRVGTHGARLGGGILTGGTDQPLGFQVVTANTWEYKTITYNTATVTATSLQYGATGVGLFLDIGFRVGGTQAGLASVASADYFQITQIQLEIGSNATSFSRAGGDLQGELAKCQRYYQLPPTAIFLHGYNSAAAGFWWQPPVVMRAAPSASLATTSPYWESVPYTTIGSLTSASLNNTKMTASGGTIIIAGTYSPSPVTSYPSLFNGSNIAFNAEL